MRFANSRPVLYATLLMARFLGRYSSRLAGPAIYLLWFIPWRIPVSDRGLKKQARWLEATEPFTLRTSVGRVGGFMAGEGSLVVLVHGWGERSASMGGFIAPLINAGFRVLGLDLPAHGKSQGQMTHGPLESAVALREVVDHFGGAHAVIAHSLGANAALLAMRKGLSLSRAVLIAPNVDINYAMETFQAMFGLPDKAMGGLKRKIERRFGPHIWHEVNGDHLASNIQARGLVMQDPDDPQVPIAGAQRLVRAWSGSELIETPDLGHGAIIRDPAVIESAVSFLSDPSLQLAEGRSA